MLTLELTTACRLAREAGAAIESVRLAGFEAVTKDDESPVTQADLASDDILTAGFAHAFPEDGLLSEESGHRPGQSGRTWIIDPLDGTKGFIRDVEGYAVQIGLVVDDAAVLGVIYEPRHGRLYRAVTGHGAFLEGPSGDVSPIAVSAHTRYQDMTLVASSSLRNSQRKRIVDKLGLVDGQPIHSVGCKVGHLVRRVADIYVSPHPIKYWDSCGPLVILLEAGGSWTHSDGRPFVFDLTAEIPVHDGPFVVSNGPRQPELCREISQLLAWST